VAAVTAHLDGYAEDTRTVLRALAFLGDATTAELAAVTGHPLPDLLRVVEETTEAGLITAGAGGRLTFRHSVVGRVLHDGIPAALRASLHRETAERLAAAGADPSRVVAQLRAGPAAADAWVLGWLAGHAEAVVARDPDAAIALLRRVTAEPPADPALRETLTAWLARALFWAGADAEGEAGWVAARTADPELAGEMGWIVALSRHHRGDHTAAVDGILGALRNGSGRNGGARTGGGRGGGARTGGGLPDRWRARYRQLLVRLTPYVSGPAPTIAIPERIPVIR
jgi:hypothetical protein